jgi:hypothetical protein
MRSKRVYTGAQTVLALSFLSASLCHAQTLGYIRGYLNDQQKLASFSTTTGALVSVYPDELANGSTFAVSSDGSTLYVPGSAGIFPNVTGVLNLVSATTGETLQSIALALPGQKVILVGNGSKAFVLEGTPNPRTIAVQAVDLTTGSVMGSIVLPSQSYRFPVDIAVSPNGSEVFVALECGNVGSCSSPLPAPCTINKGICIYSATTFAFVAEVPNLTGFLSVSQDSNSLYVSVPTQDAESLFVLNTQTLAKSKIQLGGYVSGPPVISPVGEYALVFIGSGAPTYQSKAAILDTSTNKFVKTLFAVAPDNSGAISEDRAGTGVSTLAAFAPDGKSIWAVLGCVPGNSCSLPNGATEALAGFAFPSGAPIATVPLPIFDLMGIADFSVAFPQVVKQK